MRDANPTSSSVGAPNEVPRRAASVAASTISRPGVAEQQGTPGLDEVDVAVPVRVPDVGALAPLVEPRGPAHRAERTDGRVDPAGDEPASAGEQDLVPVRSVPLPAHATDATGAGVG